MTTTPTPSSPMPCPFCGSVDMRLNVERGAGTGMFHRGEDVWYMNCYGCGVQWPGMYAEHGRQSLIEKWNTRAALASSPPGVEPPQSIDIHSVERDAVTVNLMRFFRLDKHRAREVADFMRGDGPAVDHAPDPGKMIEAAACDEPSELDIEQQFVAQLPQHSAAMVPQEVRRRYRRDDDPDYFAVLEAAYRSTTIPAGQPGHYFTVARDEPLANEFRVYMHQLPSMSMASIPLGSNREHAELMVHAINKAYAFGLERAAPNQTYGRPLVGRMGHRNRDEESMP